MNEYLVAAEECGSDLAELAQLGWPGVVVVGLFLGFLGFVIWAWTR